MPEPHSDLQLVAAIGELVAVSQAQSDRCLLLRWRLVHLCQWVLAHADSEHAAEVRGVLLDVLDARTEEEQAKLVGDTWNEIRADHGSLHRAFPRVARLARPAVLDRLRALEPDPNSVDSTFRDLRRRLQHLRVDPPGAMAAAFLHRVRLVEQIAASEGTEVQVRQRAIGALRYVSEVRDVVPDDLGIVGLLDDDFALRTVLAEFGGAQTSHWTERIAQLWDDLPFLQGLDLATGVGPVDTTWLDRACAYLAYDHVLRRDGTILHLSLPSTACQPVHVLLALVGLTVLDGLTGEDSPTDLQAGGHYEIDGGTLVVYEGVSDYELAPGWLRLRFSDGVRIRPPGLAARMTCAAAGPLSKSKSLPVGDDPLQRLFGWPEALGAARVPGRVVWITSRHDAREVLAGARSNGVRLLRDGVFRVVRSDARLGENTGGVVLIAPSPRAVRGLRESGLRISAVVVDGLRRLERGWDDLAFLRLGSDAPPIIAWENSGARLRDARVSGAARIVTATKDDLAEVAGLETDQRTETSPELRALRSALHGPELSLVHCEGLEPEADLAALAEDFWQRALSASTIPEYWLYALRHFSRRVRTLVTETPAYWSDIATLTAGWAERLNEHWDRGTPETAPDREAARLAQRRLVLGVTGCDADLNSSGEALVGQRIPGRLVLQRPFQVACAAGVFEDRRLRGLTECCGIDGAGSCEKLIVVGWPGASFGRELLARTPTRITVIGVSQHLESWSKLMREPPVGASILEVVVGGSHLRARPEEVHVVDLADEEDDLGQGESGAAPIAQADEPLCDAVLLWFANSAEGSILDAQAKVVVDDPSRAVERRSIALMPGDRVLLFPGEQGSSPAEEFTEAVVHAVRESHPRLVRRSKRWRQALSEYQQQQQGLAVGELQARLAAVGVRREVSTIEGWLMLSRAHPIGPLRLESEILAINGLTSDSQRWSAGAVTAACRQLREVRQAASHALLRAWRRDLPNVDVDQRWLRELARKLRARVAVCEVEDLVRVKVPAYMMGLTITPDQATRWFRSARCPVPD